MRFLLQEQVDNGLQISVNIHPLSGAVHVCDLGAMPSATGHTRIAWPFQWPGWAEEFLKALVGLEEGEHLEVLIRDRRIYPERGRRWEWPSDGPFKESVYPLPSARKFRLVALSDRRYRQREREIAERIPVSA